MKKLFLLSASLFFITLCHAQLKRAKQIQPGNSDTTWHNLPGQSKRIKITNGNVRLLTEPGKYDLYASYKNKKITGYYAVDDKGNKFPATYAKQGVKCYFCIDQPGKDKVVKGRVCYEVSCTNIPSPKAIKTAH